MCVCVENAPLMGGNSFFAENKMMCKNCCDICDLHGNVVAVFRLFKTGVHLPLTAISGVLT